MNILRQIGNNIRAGGVSKLFFSFPQFLCYVCLVGFDPSSLDNFPQVVVCNGAFWGWLCSLCLQRSSQWSLKLSVQAEGTLYFYIHRNMFWKNVVKPYTVKPKKSKIVKPVNWWISSCIFWSKNVPTCHVLSTLTIMFKLLSKNETN